MEKILSGKPIAALIKTTVKDLIRHSQLSPKMILIQLGNDPAADYYVQSIVANGIRLGCDVEQLSLSENTTQTELFHIINNANDDPAIHGIMIQKPLPAHIDDIIVGMSIAPDKDIDCLSPMNLGKIILEIDGMLPCTPLAVLCLLKYYRIPTQGVHTLIIGRSTIVGKPLANMLLWKKPYANASVTICHSRSKDLAALTRDADILIAAVGKAEFVTADMIKENCILIDVGINGIIMPDNKLNYVGDIDYTSCSDKALAITPVPGGIGTVTSSLLFLNLVKACLKAKGINKSVDDFLSLIFDDKQNENTHR